MGRYFRLLAFVYVFCCVVALTPKAISAPDVTSEGKTPAASRSNPSSFPELQRRGAAQEGLSDQDKGFLMMAAQSEMLQMELSKVAIARAKIPAVRRFAGATAQFMGRTASRLNNIASEFGMSLPRIAPDDVENARIALSKSRDSDREYLTGILADTKTSSNLYRDESSRGTNPVVAQYAREMSPRLTQHYRNASRLSATISRGDEVRHLRTPAARS